MKKIIRKNGWKYTFTFQPSINLIINIIIYLIAILLMISAIKNQSYSLGILSLVIATFEVEITLKERDDT